MNDDRLHDYLDGELTEAEGRLLEAKVDEDERLAEELSVLRELKADLADLPRPEAPGRRLTDAVMAKLPAPPRASIWRFVFVSLRLPAWSVMLVLVGFALALWHVSRPAKDTAGTSGFARSSSPQASPRGERRRSGREDAQGEAGARGARVKLASSSSATSSPAASIPTVALGKGAPCRPREVPVRFLFHAPKAKHVSVVGDFNGWKSRGTRLADDNGNGLWSVTVYLPPGRYQYKFIVDGKWVVDPEAPGYLVDGFGGRNAVLSI